MRPRECDTYTVWSPRECTIRARCCCGWAAPIRTQTDVVGAANDEIEHLYLFVLRQATEQARH